MENQERVGDARRELHMRSSDAVEYHIRPCSLGGWRPRRARRPSRAIESQKVAGRAYQRPPPSGDGRPGTGYNDVQIHTTWGSPMRVQFRFWKSLSTWHTIFQTAADFASQLPPNRLINISHTTDGGAGVVTVWYWADDEPATTRTDE